MSKIDYKSAIVGFNDSSFKTFFKEFFTASQTRYTRAKLPISLNQYEVSESKKENFWQTNLLKIALCFTVVVPIAAGIYKLVEMHKLKNYKFVMIKATDVLPQKEGHRTAGKVEQVKSELEKREPKETSSSKVTPNSAKTIHQPLDYTIQVTSFPRESLRRLFNWIYVKSDPADKKILDEFKALTESQIDAGRVFVLDETAFLEYETDLNIRESIKNGAHFCIRRKGRLTEKHLGISKLLIDKFEKDANVDLKVVMQQVERAVKDSKN